MNQNRKNASTQQSKDAEYFIRYRDNDSEFYEQQKKYGRAIPSRSFILELLNWSGKLDFSAIAKAFNLRKVWEQDALETRLNAMIRSGEIFIDQDELINPVDPNATIIGVVQGHTEGFGFLTPDEGGDDLFLPPYEMAKVLHSDRIEARIAGFDNRGRKIAKVIQIIERGFTQFIGRVFREGPNLTIVPENRRISAHFSLSKENSLKTRHLDIVRAEVLTYPDKGVTAQAKVIESFGDETTVEVEIEQALLEHEIPHLFPDEVKRAVKEIPTSVSPKESVGRKDYRKLPFVTIDGISARDFDDAVYATKTKQGYRLYVAIADVSHYVPQEGAISDEAELRGTSVYFPNRVIPMLPVELSNGICSLNPDVDRLTMVVELDINEKGELVHYHFFEGVMRSHARLTYKLVHSIIEGDELLRESYQHLTPHLDTLYDLYKVLRKSREKRGAIDFETTETLFIYDDQGNIERIIPDERNDAHKIIEECMITANIAAARFLEEHKMPTLYRVHMPPEADRLKQLRTFLKEFNLGLGGGDSPTPLDFANTLEKSKEHEAFEMIQMVMLRSLMQAVYQPDNGGHFGLSLTHYAHFTSPIRRYPDLLVHRAIKHLLHGGTAKNFSYTDAAMLHLGEHTSMAERRAELAVRDVIDWLKAEYLQAFIGEEFSGHITSVTNFGLFVALDELYIEGLVHISNIPGDFYNYDEERHRLIGERTRQQYRLNDVVKVQVVESNPETKHIDFALLSPIVKEGHKPRNIKNRGKESVKKRREKSSKKRRRNRRK